MKKTNREIFNRLIQIKQKLGIISFIKTEFIDVEPTDEDINELKEIIKEALLNNELGQLKDFKLYENSQI